MKDPGFYKGDAKMATIQLHKGGFKHESLHKGGFHIQSTEHEEHDWLH